MEPKKPEAARELADQPAVAIQRRECRIRRSLNGFNVMKQPRRKD